MTASERPVTVLIAAMGGEGGGVLTAWIVGAARRRGLPVQATSIPGVAQRTGATTYYIEVLGTPHDDLGGREPVLDLYPGPGNIDLMIATELVETGRAVERGFVTPDRTTLIASTHRVYTLAEKMAMGDGRIEGERVLEAGAKMARRAVMFDMERTARDVGSQLNAVILGAAAGSGVLPIPPEVFEEGIRAEGKAVERNLAGFRAGLAYARGEVVEASPATRAGETPKPAPAALPATLAALKTRVERDYPAETHAIVLEAAGRLADYQDVEYANLFLDRLDTVRAAARGEDGPALARETARHLALRMAFEDIVRVAQLKTRGSRLDRLLREVEAAPDQVVDVSEFLKPGVEEFCSLLPPALARPILAWAERHPDRARRLHLPMRVRTTTVLGFLRLRAVAALRPLRRMGHRFKTEQAHIEQWLDQVRRAAAHDPALALEVVSCARLIKGYGETYKRGLTNYRRIVDDLVEPALAGRLTEAAAAVRAAREAALADPEGAALTQALAAARNPAIHRGAAE